MICMVSHTTSKYIILTRFDLSCRFVPVNFPARIYDHSSRDPTALTLKFSVLTPKGISRPAWESPWSGSMMTATVTAR